MKHASFVAAAVLHLLVCSDVCLSRFFLEKDTDVRMSHTSGRWDSLTIEGTKQRLNLKPG